MSRSLPDSMHWQLYQAYRSGPHALFELFAHAFGRQALCGPEEPDRQQRTIESLSEDIQRLQAQVEKLEAEVRERHPRNFTLGRRNAELEALITKDSHNSSRPPSTDPPWGKRTKNLRLASGRRPGGQAGHRGETRRLSAHSNRVVEHRPRQCHSCHASLASASVVSQHRQQVWEVAPAKLKVTEHRHCVLRYPACGHRTRGELAGAVRSGVQYGPGVKALVLYLQQYQLLPYQRTAEAMRELFGCRLSAGTVANIVRECADKLVATELQIKHKLRRSAVIHTDQTGLRINKRLGYLHVASAPSLTHYAAANHRGQTALDEIDVLPRYHGPVVHDGWSAYTLYTQCGHGLCGAHLLRELTFFSELSAESKRWAEPLLKLLLELKREVAEVRQEGRERLAEERQVALTRCYEQLVGVGLKANPPPAATDQVKKQARNLLLRLERRQAQALLFMRDFAVPFDNNQAERDLRMVKLRQKTSGCFRTQQGAPHFCRIRSYLSSVRKQGPPVLKALQRACQHKPLALTS